MLQHWSPNWPVSSHTCPPSNHCHQGSRKTSDRTMRFSTKPSDSFPQHLEQKPKSLPCPTKPYRNPSPRLWPVWKHFPHSSVQPAPPVRTDHPFPIESTAPSHCPHCLAFHHTLPIFPLQHMSLRRWGFPACLLRPPQRPPRHVWRSICRTNGPKSPSLAHTVRCFAGLLTSC